MHVTRAVGSVSDLGAAADLTLPADAVTELDGIG